MFHICQDEIYGIAMLIEHVRHPILAMRMLKAWVMTKVQSIAGRRD